MRNKKNRTFEHWNIDSNYFQTEDYKLNNQIALKVSKKGYMAITKKFTHIESNAIIAVLKMSVQVYNALKGSGIDLGGGVGSVSSSVAISDNVESIICLEITENCVKECHPIVIPAILKDKHFKVESVIGDFDNIKLPSRSLDFAIAWDSIHHSNNVVKTLLEVNRVLKDNGHLIIVDRGHDNSTSDAEIERMLNVRYSEEFLIENYLPKDKVLTRRDNGEHEYKFEQWESFFKSSNFEVEASLILKEKHEKNLKSKNDANIQEKFVDFELGGFERKKIIYLLKKCKK
jgi:ubiquinone/menaquinone biosynthesis C-methylase UbiE